MALSLKPDDPLSGQPKPADFPGFFPRRHTHRYKSDLFIIQIEGGEILLCRHKFGKKSGGTLSEWHPQCRTMQRSRI